MQFVFTKLTGFQYNENQKDMFTQIITSNYILHSQENANHVE